MGTVDASGGHDNVSPSASGPFWLTQERARHESRDPAELCNSAISSDLLVRSLYG